MKKQRTLFPYGMLTAALFAITAGTTSCIHSNDSTKNDDAQPVQTESITWEEHPTNEGCKLSTLYPTDTTKAVSRNIKEWMNEELGGTYGGNLNDGKKLLAFYGEQQVDQMKRDIAEFGENSSMGQSSYYMEFQKVFETGQFITYNVRTYIYSGGAHGGESLSGAVFRKSDGRKFGWDMFTSKGKEELREMIKEKLQKDYFKTENEEEFYSMLLVEDARFMFPLPETAPIFMPDGVQFIYQQYELAPYSAGIPTCLLPYQAVKDLFTTTMTPMIESVRDSLAMSYHPTLK